jgi:hypothetical protein
LLGNDHKRHASNNRITAGSDVSCAVRAEEQLRLRESFKTAVRRAGGWCELAASLRGRENANRGRSISEDTGESDDLVRAVVKLQSV